MAGRCHGLAGDVPHGEVALGAFGRHLFIAPASDEPVFRVVDMKATDLREGRDHPEMDRISLTSFGLGVESAD